MVRAPMIWRVQSQYFSQTKVTRNLESQAPSAQCGLVSEDCADNNRAAGGATPRVRPKSELLLATGDAGWPDLRCGHSCSAVPTPYETIRQLAARHKNAPASGGFGRRCLTFKSLASPLANYSRSADKIKPSPGSWLAGTPPDEAAWWAEANLEPLRGADGESTAGRSPISPAPSPAERESRESPLPEESPWSPSNRARIRAPR